MESSEKGKLFYGYYIVGACFVILFFLWGMVLNAFPVFLKPMTEDLGWSRGTLPIASAMGALGSILTLPFAGKLIDRIGVRPVMMVGTAVIGIALALGGLVSHLWQLSAAFFFVGCGMACATMIPCSLVLSNWFISRRGTALSLAFLGTAVGGGVMAPVANWIIQNYSWRHAFVAAGVEVLVIALPIIYFVLRDKPSDMGLEPYRSADVEADEEGESWGVSEREAFGMPVFWLICALMLVAGLVTGGVGYHCVAYLDDAGHGASKAAFAWGLVMVLMAVGKVATGPIADKWGSKKTMAADYFIFALAIVLLTFAKSYPIAIAFSVLYGLSLGAPLILHPLLIGNYLGMKNFGSLFGILSIAGTIGGAIGPIIAGRYFDANGTYVPVFYAFMICMLLGAVCAVALKPTPRH
jgi:MFS family permease